MARVKVVLPERFGFKTEINVRISDINYGGHLGNDSLLSFLHEARLRYLESHGFSEKDVCGYGLIMTDAVVVYKSQAFRGKTLVVEVAAGDFSKYGCDFLFRVTDKEQGREVARAKTGFVTFDYEKDAIVTAPKEFRDKLHRGLSP